MSNTENISFRVQMGNVNNPQSYIRFSLHNDATVREQLKHEAGQMQPQTEFVVVKVDREASDEVLDKLFGKYVGLKYTDMLKAEQLVYNNAGSQKVILFNLIHFGGGKFSENVLPLLQSAPELQGNLSIRFESDQTGHDARALQEKGLTAAYAPFKSLRVEANTNFSHQQLGTIASLVETMVGLPVPTVLFELFANVDIQFDSWEDLPAQVTEGVLDAKKTPFDTTVKNFLNSPLTVVDTPLEIHAFLSPNISLKLEVHIPGVKNN